MNKKRLTTKEKIQEQGGRVKTEQEIMLFQEKKQKKTIVNVCLNRT